MDETRVTKGPPMISSCTSYETLFHDVPSVQKVKRTGIQNLSPS